MVLVLGMTADAGVQDAKACALDRHLHVWIIRTTERQAAAAATPYLYRGRVPAIR
jgi:hypothetical protein